MAAASGDGIARQLARRVLSARARHGLWKMAVHRPRHLLYRALDWRARAGLRRAGVLEMLDAVGRSRPAEALPPDYADLWFLYRTARRMRPRIVLEFGSGWSTAVLAAALSDAGCAKPALVSIESDARWADVTRRTMPDDLKEFCRVVHCPVVPIEHGGVSGWRHEGVPEVAADLVYLDGPPLTAERAVAVDLLALEPLLPIGAVVIIDERDENARFLCRHFTRRWRYRDPGWVWKRRKLFELIG